MESCSRSHRSYYRKLSVFNKLEKTQVFQGLCAILLVISSYSDYATLIKSGGLNGGPESGPVAILHRLFPPFPILSAVSKRK